ncbi:universal stress protein [Salegentibacter salarius]|uniref:Universal stress protein n=1 Tax=Salegentibacter salarius TaxID=435906 RepID=A0A2N0TZB8_9FLAO|nr:universal stress protein [Salegentibacter salarius]OEY73249.1 universal stress protein UspA [Salegentibacter salarius]PKD20069.1 universal stress protein UspA [Salegentibacter salarius]SLJ98308.1 Nucleotide-binding universal stress protein, UspA family [Salegentibacter salarius]
MKNLLVAIDRRQDAEQLMTQAIKIAKLTDAKIWIMHVTEADPDDFLAREAGPQYVYEKRAKERKNASLEIQKWVEEVKEKYSIDIEGLVINGEVTKSIKNIVDERNIDLVVAGHKKKSLLYGLFTANKKKDLIDDLKVPLLAIPLV